MKMLCKLLLVLFFAWWLPMNDAKGYCGADLCNDTKQHTLCKFQSEDPARHCIDFEQTIKTGKDKQAVLDKLNGRRNKVAGGEIRSLPAAQGMMKLEWNEELETSAQRWANQCVKHNVPDIIDSCRDLRGVNVAQSIATIAGDAPGLTPAALVDIWYMELLNVNASILPNYQPSAVTGYSSYDYFTQLVWAQTSKVGCGGVKFKERVPDMSRELNRTIYRLVCNFAPGGNRPGRPVYIAGAPCSRCPVGGNCDAAYKALCTSKTPTTRPTTKHSTKAIGNVKAYNSKGPSASTNSSTTPNPATAASTTENEEFTPFDYFSHLHEFVRPTLTTLPTTPVPCKDVLAVEDFIELLKRKISGDPTLNNMMSKKMETYTDPSVAAFVSRLYSKITTVSPTTVSSDYVNSTLLVDLVEAVIFRSGDKTQSTYAVEHNQAYPSDVSAVKIQAELAEVKQNTDFTGHYFFPEDVETDGESEASSEITDMYYDATSPHVSDILREIEDIKRIKPTKDFLDDILDAESDNEQHTNYAPMVTTIDAESTDSDDAINEDLLTRVKRQDEYGLIDDDDRPNFKAYNDIQLKCIETNSAKLDFKSCHIKYKDLLKKLASDISIFRLNERFHCVGNSSNGLSLTRFIFIILYFVC